MAFVRRHRHAFLLVQKCIRSCNQLQRFTTLVVACDTLYENNSIYNCIFYAIWHYPLHLTNVFMCSNLVLIGTVASAVEKYNVCLLPKEQNPP